MLDPLKVIAECLGEPADSMRSPANADYRCPYTDRKCSKTNHTTSDPFPVCSVYRKRRSPASTPVCVCPVRFYEANVAQDVIDHCWIGEPPTNVRLAYEVNMQKFGNVDLVVADVDDEAMSVRSFVPVELQAVDITGSYFPAFEALTNNRMLDRAVQYGFNWANVRKRFISQLIAKGFFCSQWDTRIVAVVQEDLFEQFTAHSRMTETVLAGSNIVFMLYQYDRVDGESPWSLSLRRIVPTTHANVMQSVLYERPPERVKFESKILDRMLP